MTEKSPLFASLIVEMDLLCWIDLETIRHTHSCTQLKIRSKPAVHSRVLQRTNRYRTDSETTDDQCLPESLSEHQGGRDDLQPDSQLDSAIDSTDVDTANDVPSDEAVDNACAQRQVNP